MSEPDVRIVIREPELRDDGYSGISGLSVTLNTGTESQHRTRINIVKTDPFSGEEYGVEIEEDDLGDVNLALNDVQAELGVISDE
jgi:hypothetical protein